MSVIKEVQVGLVPGQGSYQPDKLRSLWLSGDPIVTKVFAEIDEVAATSCGHKLTSVIFADSPPALKDMVADHADLLQLAIFGQSIAVFRLLEQSGVRLTVLVGHSFGEIAALVCAGAFSLETGAGIVCHRSAALRNAGVPAGLMLALACNRERAQELLTFLKRPMITLAADNGPEQVVVSGPRADVDLVGDLAQAVRIGSAPVRSPYPFHNPMLAAASLDFTARIAGCASSPLQRPVFSAILGRYYRDEDDLARLLGQHLVTPVRFRQAVEQLHDAGARVFVEIGGAKALTTLVRSSYPEVMSLSPLAEAATDASFAATIRYLLGDTADPLTAGPAGTNPFTEPSLPPAAVSIVGEHAQAEPPEGIGKPAPAAVAGGLSQDDVLASLRTLYAEALDYPEDVLTADARLEADLGVDSIKQVELMAKVGEQFRIDVASDRVDLMALDTIGKVAEFVHGGAGSAP
ncbi:acyltransferase domain-containing protein [Kribbella antibiotica]|uniref:[acyl-carrier-protein] S-malonyltransferase n=1 Tax=Kribbella antibiotica TaxID=190195 RepID=A0A4R4ZRQ4_9ACTN|nr:acyltransferase domain-containing protein [Kribbella antibiotica]TDD61681.1 acyltransferase domain-containing protein [Kribbella antibiotica]